MKRMSGIVQPELSSLEKKLNYRFKRIELLQEALTHPSYAVEKNIPYTNQRLEFLGDAVLDVVMAEHLFFRYPEANEGGMTKMRSALVCQDALVQVANDISLAAFMRVGNGERTEGGIARKSIVADALEALFGAVYLDGGMAALKEVCRTLFSARFPEPSQLIRKNNPKGELQEFSQAKWGETPQYTVCNISGPEHNPQYTVEVALHGYVAQGKACSRKAAEGVAARKLLRFLENGKAEQ